MAFFHEERRRKWRSYLDLANFLALLSLKKDARQNILSYSWWIIEPLSQLILYFVAFGVLMHSQLDAMKYLATLFCGLVTWRWFTIGVTMGSNTLKINASFLRSFKLPTVLFVLSAQCEAFVRSAPIFVMMLLFCLFTQNISYNELWWLFYIAFVQMTFIIAITSFFSWLVVYISDLSNVIDIGLRSGMFLSAVFYTVDNLSPQHQEYMMLNPIVVIIESYRDVLVNADDPHWIRLSVIGLMSMIFAVINYFIHRRIGGKLAALLV